MIRMLHSDLRRMLRTRGFYIAFAVLTIFVLTAAFSVWHLSNRSAAELVRHVRERTDTDVNAAADVAAAMLDASQKDALQQRIRREMSFERLLSLPFGGGMGRGAASGGSLAYIALTLLFAAFAGVDYRTGYLKNLLTLPHARRSWFLSKMLCALAMAALLYTGLLPAAFFGTLILGNPMPGDIVPLIRYLGQQLLIGFALCMTTLAMLTLFQKKTPAQIIGMFFASGVHTVFFFLIDLTALLPFSLQDINLLRAAAGIAIGTPMPAEVLSIGAPVIAGSVVLGAASLFFRDIKM